ncbi:unnamed protein product [Prunus armeniaca]
MEIMSKEAISSTNNGFSSKGMCSCTSLLLNKSASARARAHTHTDKQRCRACGLITSCGFDFGGRSNNEEDVAGWVVLGWTVEKFWEGGSYGEGGFRKKVVRSREGQRQRDEGG